jgi:hypothetical protein
MKNLKILFFMVFICQMSFSQNALWKYEDQKIQVKVWIDTVNKDSLQVKFIIQNLNKTDIYIRNESFILASLDGQNLKLGFGVFSGLKRYDGNINLVLLAPFESMEIFTNKILKQDYRITEISFDYIPIKINKKRLKYLDSNSYQELSVKILSIIYHECGQLSHF